VDHRRLGAGGRELVLWDPMGPPGSPSRLGCEARLRQRRATRRGLLRGRFGQLAQGLGGLRILLLPAFAPTKDGAPQQTRPVRCSARPTSTA